MRYLFLTGIFCLTSWLTIGAFAFGVGWCLGVWWTLLAVGAVMNIQNLSRPHDEDMNPVVCMVISLPFAGFNFITMIMAGAVFAPTIYVFAALLGAVEFLY